MTMPAGPATVRGSVMAARAFACGLLCIAAAAAGAQARVDRAAMVTVSVVPETVTVGQPFSVRIRVRAPKFATIRFPAVPDTADAIEAVDPRAIEDAGDDELIDRTAVYRLVAWDIGRRTPHFGNVTIDEGGAAQPYAVALPAVTVRSLLPSDSADRVPKDARAPVPPPGVLWEFLMLGALVLMLLGWYWRRRRAARALRIPPRAEPFVEASSSFDALDALGLPAAGESGRHVIASVDVVRGYLARRFPDVRESLTPHEVGAVLAESELPILPARVTALLERESSLRFARAGISADEALALAKESRAIVTDIQQAYEARLRAAARRPQRGRRR
ncbi:MAG TPA: hypothetical protein VN613_09550 [Gemmatimonadaceae bacterium]|nr:hypothetical protein [Gemmatimonadaceae bacterium]